MIRQALTGAVLAGTWLGVAACLMAVWELLRCGWVMVLLVW